VTSHTNGSIDVVHEIESGAEHKQPPAQQLLELNRQSEQCHDLNNIDQVMGNGLVRQVLQPANSSLAISTVLPETKANEDDDDIPFPFDDVNVVWGKAWYAFRPDQTQTMKTDNNKHVKVQLDRKCIKVPREMDQDHNYTWVSFGVFNQSMPSKVYHEGFGKGELVMLTLPEHKLKDMGREYYMEYCAVCPDNTNNNITMSLSQPEWTSWYYHFKQESHKYFFVPVQIVSFQLSDSGAVQVCFRYILPDDLDAVREDSEKDASLENAHLDCVTPFHMKSTEHCCADVRTIGGHLRNLKPDEIEKYFHAFVNNIAALLEIGVKLANKRQTIKNVITHANNVNSGGCEALQSETWLQIIKGDACPFQYTNRNNLLRTMHNFNRHQTNKKPHAAANLRELIHALWDHPLVFDTRANSSNVCETCFICNTSPAEAPKSIHSLMVFNSDDPCIDCEQCEQACPFSTGDKKDPVTHTLCYTCSNEARRINNRCKYFLFYTHHLKQQVACPSKSRRMFSRKQLCKVTQHSKWEIPASTNDRYESSLPKLSNTQQLMYNSCFKVHKDKKQSPNMLMAKWIYAAFRDDVWVL
jgi:Fe-S-cluster-containing hydrogenase component 2